MQEWSLRWDNALVTVAVHHNFWNAKRLRWISFVIALSLLLN